MSQLFKILDRFTKNEGPFASSAIGTAKRTLDYYKSTIASNLSMAKEKCRQITSRQPPSFVAVAGEVNMTSEEATTLESRVAALTVKHLKAGASQANKTIKPATASGKAQFAKIHRSASLATPPAHRGHVRRQVNCTQSNPHQVTMARRL